MSSRRRFLSSALAAAAIPMSGWAAVGRPTHLTAARTPSGTYVMVGLRSDGTQAFTVPLPDRGHAAAAHPTRAQAVAFARRPGNYALVIDCVAGQVTQRFAAPKEHHFYGHGAFSADGSTLFTTENHIASGAGRIGVWDATAGYRRIGEFASGGIGPHEILRVPGTDKLAIANGGIRTDPARGRDKLNLDTMRPNLTVIRSDGMVLDVAEMPADIHQNSLRHIAAFENGRIACAFQWQGDPFAAPSIAGLYAQDAGISLLEMSEHDLHGLDGYAGSAAVLDASRVMITFPRGGVMKSINMETGTTMTYRQPDICGIAASTDGGMATDGVGHIHLMRKDKLITLPASRLSFDNHLVRISTM